MRLHASVGLVVAAFCAAVLGVACGGGEGPGAQVPAPPGPSASASASAAPPGSAAPAGSGPSTAIVPPAGSAQPAPVGPMKPIAASAFADDLKKLGIDPLKPPPLNKLTPDTVRKLMPSFAKSLGVKCAACHDTDNFKTWTPKKRIASRMWNEFVAGMAMEDGTPLYCDSCHGGSMQFLDRHDKKALSGWMDANYVKKLKRTDKKEASCEGCHGDPFEPRFLSTWEVASK